jgi:hypothetical protein
MKYTYKNKNYTLISEAQTKDINSREWYDSVIYRQDESGLIFTRYAIDFYFKFERV